MLKISSSVEYACRIMVRLSLLDDGQTTSAERLSVSENIPRDYVDKILQRLRKAGLVQSHRGALGGYGLGKAASRISLGDILNAVDDGVFEAVCDRYSEGESRCSHTLGCSIRPVWRGLESMIAGYLSKVALTQLRENEDCVSTRVNSLFETAG